MTDETRDDQSQPPAIDAPVSADGESVVEGEIEAVLDSEDVEHLQELAGKLQGFPPDVRVQVMGAIMQGQSGEFQMTHRTMRKAPIPPPDEFAEYESILPGSADRILALTEREQGGRITASTMELNNERSFIMNDRLRAGGSIFVSVLMVALAAFCAYIQQPILAGVFGTTGILTTVLRTVLQWLAPKETE